MSFWSKLFKKKEKKTGLYRVVYVCDIGGSWPQRVAGPFTYVDACTFVPDDVRTVPALCAPDGTVLYDWNPVAMGWVKR